jgi:hypothetical protein
MGLKNAWEAIEGTCVLLCEVGGRLLAAPVLPPCSQISNHADGQELQRNQYAETITPTSSNTKNLSDFKVGVRYSC